jgi:uncharacterized protein (DUF924 family)
MTEQPVELVSTHYDGINIMTEQSVELVSTHYDSNWLKSSLRMFYDNHHDFVHRYGVYVSHMTTYMFRSSSSQSGSFLIHYLSPWVASLSAASFYQ